MADAQPRDGVYILRRRGPGGVDDGALVVSVRKLLIAEAWRMQDEDYEEGLSSEDGDEWL